MHLVRQTVFMIMVMEIYGLSFQTHFGKNGQFRRKKATHSLDRSTSDQSPREIVEDGIRTSDYSVVDFNDQVSGTVGLSNPDSPSRGPTSKLNHTNAKGFWNHFMFRRRSGFQSVLPIQNNEVHQEKCRTIPFWQRVAHEDCETQLLKNNVCFGKCGIPRTSDESTACLLCSPIKLIQKAVQLKCKDSTEITKDVKMVEECQCKEHTGRNFINRNGPALIDPSIEK